MRPEIAIRVIISLLAAFTCCTAPLIAQSIVVHRGIFSDDGREGIDGDGTVNKTVVFTAGKVHVVVGQYGVSKGEKVTVQPGAIVKFCDRLDYVDGVVRSFTPPSDAGFISHYYHYDIGGFIQIDGAVLTDFRDDAEGGDSNQDGAATQPGVNASMAIRFSGSSQDNLTNSRVKYFAKIGHLGSIKIASNTFHGLFWITSSDGYPMGMTPIEEGAVPEIINNTFHFADNNGFVDVRGYAARVEGNTFASGGSATAVLQLGPRQASVGNQPEGAILPKGGQAIVASNTFNTKGGVIIDASYDGDSLFTKTTFSAIVVGNTFNRSDGQGQTAITVNFDADVDVLGNTVTGYNTPFYINMDRGSYGSRDCEIEIHGNTFELHATSTQVLGNPMWETTPIMINAEGNYWGSPSGPLDASNKDGLHNPNGRGWTIRDGIDYKPFIGGEVEAPRDVLQISATATPMPLAPGQPATITVNVARLSLTSARSARVLVVVRDHNGYQVNTNGTGVPITAGSTSATIPPITLTVPELALSLTVTAYIVFDGNVESVASNAVPIDVPQPKDAFSISGVYDAVTGWPLIPSLVRGQGISARVDFEYTHVAGEVKFDVVLREVERATGAPIETLKEITFTVPAGANMKASQVISLLVPFRDALQYPNADLYGAFVATDASGKVLGKTDGRFPISPAAIVSSVIGVPLKRGGPGGTALPIGRAFFLEGEEAVFALRASYNVFTPNVTDWQLWIGPVEFLDASGTILATSATAKIADNVATGKGTKDHVGATASVPAIPVGTRKVRPHVRVVSPRGDFTVAVGHFDIEVQPRPTETVQMQVATGAQTLAFNPIPATLTFASNQSTGTATAMEFGRQFMGRARKVSPLLQAAEGIRFISLNRYWAVFDTLREQSFDATLSLTYDPARDFPSDASFSEESLVITGYNPNSGSLEELPTTFYKDLRRLSTPYSQFYDIYVIASRAADLPLSLDDNAREVRPSHGVIAAHPQPALEAVTLSVDVQSSGEARLEIFDMLGRAVALVHDGHLDGGRHQLRWSTRDVPAGLYIARLRIGNQEHATTVVRGR